MDEVIEQYYQQEVESDRERLMRGEISRNWGELIRIVQSERDDSSESQASNIISEMVTEAARNGFDVGFRAAFRFLLSL